MRLIFFLLLLTLSSCSQQYFDQPQPIDGKNVYAFPEPFRGIWTDGRDSLIVGKFFFANIEYKNLSVPYTTADTTAYALFRNNRVYPYDSVREQVTGVGSPFEIRNDSIYYEIREILEVQLGRKAFLREVDNQFVLNVKNEYGWWELFLMGVTEQQKMVITYPNTDQMIDQGINPILSSSEEDYFEVQWTTKQFNQLIQDNIFSDTLLFVDQQN